jgi:hypothetical protein
MEFFTKIQKANILMPITTRIIKADHYIFQLQRTVDGRSLRFETYYKKYEDLVKTSNNFYKPIAINNNGSGYAKGIELFGETKKL